MIPEEGIVEDHSPLLFRKLHSPDEPSEKLAVSGIVASLTMVAHPVAVAMVIAKIIFRIFSLSYIIQFYVKYSVPFTSISMASDALSR